MIGKGTSESSDGKTFDLKFGFSVLKLFDSIVFVVLQIENFKNSAICSLTHFIYNLVLGPNVIDP